MADAPDTSQYLLVSNDSSLENAKILEAGTAFNLIDAGPGSTLTIQPTGNLLNLANFDTTGYLTYNASSSTFTGRTLVGSDSVSIINTDGVDGNSTFSVTPSSVLQKVQVLNNESTINSSTQGELSFIEGSNITFTIVDNDPDDRADITISTTGSAPLTSTYITQTPDTVLSNSQALSTLGTGLLMSTTGTGVISTAVAGVDYQGAYTNLTDISAITPTSGSMIVGNGTSFVGFPVGANGTVLQSTGTNIEWSSTGIGTMTSIGLSSSTFTIPPADTPITSSGTFQIFIPSSGVTQGSYTNADLTVDTYGRITSASNGDSGITWNTVTSPTAFGMSSNNGYIINLAPSTYCNGTLPHVGNSNLGDIFTVTVLSGGGVQVSLSQALTYFIYNGNTYTSGSSLYLFDIGDSLTYVADGNDNYIVISFSGTPSLTPV